MASIINSIEEHPEYPFDHLIRIEPMNPKTSGVCVAIDQFTNQMYVYIHDLSEVVFSFIRIGAMLIYSQCGEFLRSLSLKYNKDFDGHVHGMAIHKNNVYIISLPSCILHLKVADSMTLIGSKNAKGSGIGEFMEPRQLDISKEGDLFVADFGNNRVQILDGNLQYKRHISHHSMLKPCDVKLTPDEVYVLGDCPEESTYCCHIFTYLGEKLRSIIFNGFPNNKRWIGFCVDTRGNVAIIDDATSQIKFFTKEGNLIGTMDKLGLTYRIEVAWITKQKLVVLCGGYSSGLEIYY